MPNPIGRMVELQPPGAIRRERRRIQLGVGGLVGGIRAGKCLSGAKQHRPHPAKRTQRHANHKRPSKAQRVLPDPRQPARRRLVGCAGRRSRGLKLHHPPGAPGPPTASPHLTSPHLTTPHLTTPHLTSPGATPHQRETANRYQQRPAPSTRRPPLLFQNNPSNPTPKKLTLLRVFTHRAVDLPPLLLLSQSSSLILPYLQVSDLFL